MPDTNIRFLLHAIGPLEDIFAAPLQLSGSTTKYDGSQTPVEFDLLVLDPRSLKAAAFAESAALAKRMLDNNKPVLVLRPSKAHKQILASAGALRTYGATDSVALLIEPRGNLSNKLQLALAEQFGPQAGHPRLIRTVSGGGPVDILPVTPPADPNLQDMAKFIDRVMAAVHSRRGGPAHSLVAGNASPDSPPSEIPVGLYDITPINLYFPIITSGSADGGFTPPNGSVYLEALVTIGVYYDNLSYNTPVQWLLIEHSGLFYTMGLEMDDKWHIGWSIGELDIGGQNISSQTLVTRQSSPNNVNNQTEYTSSSEFTVGVAAGTDGLNGNANYTIGSSQTSAISDWTVVQISPDNWDFYQQTPYDGSTAPGTFPDGAAGSGGVASLPPISTGALAFTTQTVWVQQPANNQDSNIGYVYYTQCFFTYASKTGPSWKAVCWCFPSTPYQWFNIDWSAAWPSTI